MQYVNWTVRSGGYKVGEPAKCTIRRPGNPARTYTNLSNASLQRLIAMNNYRPTVEIDDQSIVVSGVIKVGGDYD